jgi:glycosyltransferase involved in cell wall biosynthesis
VKVIIQVPCFNEEASLPLALSALPRELPHVDTVEWLVIDDGSSDRTVEVARSLGVDHIVTLGRHRGLAATFKAGLEACLELGADIVVNTDADNQYRAEDIVKLIEPILAGQADMVVGARPLLEIPHFSWTKRWLQVIGSWIVCRFSGATIPDTRSGFRALTRRLASQLEVFSRYTYTLETLIQAGHEKYRIESVPVRTNPDLRPSRLIRNIPSDLCRSTATILAAYFRYSPIPAFVFVGAVSALGCWGSGSPDSAPVFFGAWAGMGYLSHLMERNRRLLRELRPFAQTTPIRVSKLANARLRLVSQS